MSFTFVSNFFSRLRLGVLVGLGGVFSYRLDRLLLLRGPLVN